MNPEEKTLTWPLTTLVFQTSRHLVLEQQQSSWSITFFVLEMHGTVLYQAVAPYQLERGLFSFWPHFLQCRWSNSSVFMVSMTVSIFIRYYNMWGIQTDFTSDGKQWILQKYTTTWNALNAIKRRDLQPWCVRYAERDAEMFWGLKQPNVLQHLNYKRSPR